MENLNNEKVQAAWNKFQGKIIEIKKRKHEILTKISESLDRQHLEKLRKKLKEHE